MYYEFEVKQRTWINGDVTVTAYEYDGIAVWSVFVEGEEEATEECNTFEEACEAAEFYSTYFI